MNPPLTCPAPPRANGHRVVALIAGLLILPFVVATLLWVTGWQPLRQLNHGELLATADRPLLQLHENDLVRWPGEESAHRSPADAGPPSPGDARRLPDRGALQSSHGDSLRSPQRGSFQSSHGDSLRSPQMDSFQSQRNPGNAALAANGPPDKALLGHWLLALVVPGQCTADCLTQLHLARQVQVSLNKDMARLRRALIGPRLDDRDTLAAAQRRWPDLLIARPTAAGWQTLGAGASAPQLVLIDPQGVLVLRYPPTPDARGLRRDVERLLKYSWLG